MKETEVLPPLKWSEKIGYGVGDMASNLIYQAVSLFLLFYWTESVGLGIAAAGTILLVSRIFDGISDVFFGAVVDKTNTKYGKARPFLLWLAIPLALSFIITFWSPGASQTINLIYAFVTYNLTMLLYTAINIPYGVLSAKMTGDQTERGLLTIIRTFGALVGMLILFMFAPQAVENYGYLPTVTVLGVISAVLFFVTFATTKERVGNDENSEPIHFKKSIPLLFKNKAWIIMVIASLLSFTSLTLGMTATAYFAEYYLGDVTLVSQLSMIGLPGMFIGLLCAAPLYKKFGKVKVTSHSSILVFINAVIFFFYINSPEDLNIILTFKFISSIFLGIGMSGFFAMILDTIEYGEWKTGVRLEGLTYSAGSLGTKVGGGIGAGLVGMLFASAGHVTGATSHPQAVTDMSAFLYLWLPAIITLCTGLLLLLNDTDKKFPEIQAELQRRKEEGVKNV